MGSSVTAMFLISMIFLLISLPPIQACGYCSPPYHRPNPPIIPHPPHHGKERPPKVSPPKTKPPSRPPIIIPPPIIGSPPNPPIIIPPPSSTYPPYTGNPPSGGGGLTPPGIIPPPSTHPTCPINALKLGLCVDVLGGLVHIGLGNPVENACCPVIQGLLELEAAICLCTTIRLKLLNLNIFIPIALQVLITCGLTPPPGFVCPPPL